MWRCSGVLRVKRQKASDQCLYLRGGGVKFSPNTSHVIRKWMVNAILVMGHQTTWRTARNIIFYRQTAVHNILQHYFVSGERRWIARINSRWYNKVNFKDLINADWLSWCKVNLLLWGKNWRNFWLPLDTMKCFIVAFFSLLNSLPLEAPEMV
jgi:hypothetical protein